MKNHIANVDSETRTHVCSVNLGITGSERGTLLTISLPSDRAAGAENDGAAHAAEFEERELYALPDCISDLQTPTRVAVGGESMMLVGAGRKGVNTFGRFGEIPFVILAFMIECDFRVDTKEQREEV